MERGNARRRHAADMQRGFGTIWKEMGGRLHAFVMRSAFHAYA